MANKWATHRAIALPAPKNSKEERKRKGKRKNRRRWNSLLSYTHHAFSKNFTTWRALIRWKTFHSLFFNPFWRTRNNECFHSSSYHIYIHVVIRTDIHSSIHLFRLWGRCSEANPWMIMPSLRLRLPLLEIPRACLHCILRHGLRSAPEIAVSKQGMLRSTSLALVLIPHPDSSPIRRFPLVQGRIPDRFVRLGVTELRRGD